MMKALTLWAAWAVSPQDFSSPVLKFLAVAGGAVIGGLLIGFVGRAATRMLTTRPMPVWGVRTLRVVGGVASGWLVYLYLSSGGGTGVGGPGGNKPGSGDKDKPHASKPAEKDPSKKRDDKQPPPGEPLRIEVLGSRALKILKEPAGGSYHGYRIQGDEEKKLYDLASIEGVLRERRQKTPKLRVVLVIYKDSPDRDLPVVADLVEWLTKEEITWEVAEPPEYSPEVTNSQP
jgi:hypothetical protein